MQLGVLEYLISVNDKGVQSGVNKSERTILQSAKNAEKGLKEYGNKISAWTIAKGQMIASATTKVVKTLASTTKSLIKESITSYADYEQLVGGVETLFKDSAIQVQKFAKKAYKNAGISANEYMETVTSFSASLLQSLKGDTDKAADYADMAINDMADNANKMGSTMESIQNAYQGFAKQNYTMLDNLKLGYGGTRTEMERLLKDAGKLVNRKFDISKLSDVYEAIHIIQQEMGIFGTTQKEAEGTITGSINMMKASWKDLLTSLGSGKNIRETSKNLTKSLKLVLKNITPVATNAFKNIFSTIKDILPDLKATVKDVWSSVKESFNSNTFMSKITQKLDDFMGVFNLVSDLITDFDGTMEKLGKSNSPLLRGLKQIIGLIDTLFEDINKEVGESDNLFLGLVKGFASFAGKAIVEFANWIGDNSEEISGAIVNILTALINAIPKIAKPLIDALMELVRNEDFWSGLVNILGSIVEGIARGILGDNLYETIFGKTKTGRKTDSEYWANRYKQQQEKQQAEQKATEEYEASGAQLTSEQQNTFRDYYKALVSGNQKAISAAMTATEKLFPFPDVDSVFDEWTYWITKVEDFFKTEGEDVLPDDFFIIDPSLAPGAQGELQDELNKGSYTINVTPVLDSSLTDDTNNPNMDNVDWSKLFDSNAKGNWSVPYDNFPALLHRDEMVLTKSQARQFRDGGYGGMNAGMGDAIAAAVEKAMSRVYVMMSGEKVGDLTTRRIRNNLNASSYSKLRALGG